MVSAWQWIRLRRRGGWWGSREHRRPIYTRGRKHSGKAIEGTRLLVDPQKEGNQLEICLLWKYRSPELPCLVDAIPEIPDRLDNEVAIMNWIAQALITRPHLASTVSTSKGLGCAFLTSSTSFILQASVSAHIARGHGTALQRLHIYDFFRTPDSFRKGVKYHSTVVNSVRLTRTGSAACVSSI